MEKNRFGITRFASCLAIMLLVMLGCEEKKASPPTTETAAQKTEEHSQASKPSHAAPLEAKAPTCVAGIKKVDRDLVGGSLRLIGGEIALPTEMAQFHKQTLKLIAFNEMQSSERALMAVKPIIDSELRQRFDAAQKLILSLKPPCAWRWEKVQELIRKHGGYIIYKGAGEINPYAAEQTRNGKDDSIMFQAFLQSREDLEEKTREMAIDMVRAATIVVYESALMEWAGYDLVHLQTAAYACRQFDFHLMFISDMVRIWNAYRVRQAIYGDHEIPDDELPTVEGALRDFDRGDSDQFVWIAASAAMKIVQSKPKTEMRDLFNEGSSSPCSLPPVLSGTNVGHEFLPFDIDDGLINLFEREFLRFAKKYSKSGKSLTGI